MMHFEKLYFCATISLHARLHALVAPLLKKQIVWFLNPLRFAFHMISATITLRSLNYDRTAYMKFVNFVFDASFQLAERLILHCLFLSSNLCVTITLKADASSVFLVKQVRSAEI